MKQRILGYARDNAVQLLPLAKLLNSLPGNNTIRIGSTNRLRVGAALLKSTSIRVKGAGNLIEIADRSMLLNCQIFIRGNRNRIILGEHVVMKRAEFWIEDDENLISIGENTIVAGTTHLAAIEGTSILVGHDCLFASDIRFATGDGHSIIAGDGARMNQSKSIKIGNHVWVGTSVIGLKGVEIAGNTTIGTGSLLRGKYDEENVVIAGRPAKVVKRGVNWAHERI